MPENNPQDEHPLRDQDNYDDWQDFDTIDGSATPRKTSDNDEIPAGSYKNWGNNAPPNQDDSPLKPKAPLPPAKYSWSEVWTAAVTKPNVSTYRELLTDPRADWRRAGLWVFLTLAVSVFVTLAIAFNDPALAEAFALSAPEGADMEIPTSFLMTSLVIAVPITAGFGVMLFAGFVYAVQYVAQRIATSQQRTLENAFSPLAFVLAASLAPLNLISALFLIFPLPLVGFVLTAYQVYLLILGAQAVYQFELRDASFAILIPVGGLFVLQLLLLGSFF
jgi:hypothetical protein